MNRAINYLRPVNDLHLDVDAYFNQHAKIKREIWVPPYHEKDFETALIVAGDIWLEDRCIPWLIDMGRRYAAVVCVLGNHDYWGDCINLLPGKIRAKLADNDTDNVHILQNTGITINLVEFVGGTLWTDFNKQDPITRMRWPFIMEKDAKKIRFFKDGEWKKLRDAKLIEEHIKTREFIFDAHKYKLAGTRKKIVITHHAPTFDAAADYGDHIGNGYYCTELVDRIEQCEHMDYWFFGHVHTAYDKQVGNCRLICNPRGYVGWEPGIGFNPDLLIKI